MPDRQAPPSRVLESVLLATDLSPRTATAQDFALRLAVASGACVEIVYVLYALPTVYPENLTATLYLEQLRSELERPLETLAARFREKGLDAHARQLLGIASDGILEVARESSVDLIVLGREPTSSSDRTDSHWLPSVTDRVIKAAPCPILIVPEKPNGSLNAPRLRLVVLLRTPDGWKTIARYGYDLARLLNAHVTFMPTGSAIRQGTAQGRQSDEAIRALRRRLGADTDGMPPIELQPIVADPIEAIRSNVRPFPDDVIVLLGHEDHEAAAEFFNTTRYPLLIYKPKPPTGRDTARP